MTDFSDNALTNDDVIRRPDANTLDKSGVKVKNVILNMLVVSMGFL